jgi:hypothetical protein
MELRRRRTWTWVTVGVAVSGALLAVGTGLVLVLGSGARSLNHPWIDCTAYFARQPEARLTFPGGTLASYTVAQGRLGIGQPDPHADATVTISGQAATAVDGWYRDWLGRHAWSQLSDAGRAPFAHVWTKGAGVFEESIKLRDPSASSAPTFGALTVRLVYSLATPADWTVCQW